jgi:pyruvate/2-oxoglutarate dehydrogenase complex dihydrolipoamide dehydrogenase (E3) component
MPIHLGATVEQATVQDAMVHLHFTQADGSPQRLLVDHVVAATGYRPALSRLKFLDESLRTSLRQVMDTPVLDRNFGSSVRGLHFAGPLSANSFGPLVRFAYGAQFTARRLARHFAGL